MKIAVMQPYFFPYIGYYQLINSVDKFIFYDDVNYIKGGWINRNAILANKQKCIITVNLCGSSSFKKINEIEVGKYTYKVFKTIEQSYAKAPYFKEVIPVIKDVFDEIKPKSLISDIAGMSVIKTCGYIGLDVEFEYSSISYPDTRDYGRLERLIEICNKNNCTDYINAQGGKELYSKAEFASHKINLHFINNNITAYKQYNNDFISHLSVIDVLMFNSRDAVIRMLEDYTLE